MKIPCGFLFSATSSGIKKKGALDLGVIAAENFLTAEGFFTRNKNISYSVLASKKNINNSIKAVLVNSGNANCFSHNEGLKDTYFVMEKLAEALKVKRKNILIASTGIIGRRLPVEKIIKKIPLLTKNLNQKVFPLATSIMTTDTFPKIAYGKVNLRNETARILGIAKGAGMISPELVYEEKKHSRSATMLGFILTDAGLSSSLRKKIYQEAIEESFNSINVDGCLSTNDTVFFLSSEKIPLTKKKEIDAFARELKKVCKNLARMIVLDAEGAKKIFSVKVRGAKTLSEAKLAVKAIINSNLIKCSVFGGKPNPGRVIAALGQVGVRITEAAAIKEIKFATKFASILVDLKRGRFSWEGYGCDLTPEYIKINSHYN